MERTTLLRRHVAYKSNLHSGKPTWLAGKWTRIEDASMYFLLKHGDIPASYVSLPKCIKRQNMAFKRQENFPPLEAAAAFLVPGQQ